METGTEVTVEVVEDCSVVQGDLVTAFSAALLVWKLSLMIDVFLFSVSPLTKHVVLTPLFQPVGGVAQEVFHLPHLWGRLGMEAVAKNVYVHLETL